MPCFLCRCSQGAQQCQLVMEKVHRACMCPHAMCVAQASWHWLCLCLVGQGRIYHPACCRVGCPHAAWALTPAGRAHVPEPSVDETYEILLGLRERYEAHHKLRYTDESLSAAAKFSSQYISDRFLPDKARAALDY